jgi:hypothetical protein
MVVGKEDSFRPTIWNESLCEIRSKMDEWMDEDGSLQSVMEKIMPSSMK